MIFKAHYLPDTDLQLLGTKAKLLSHLPMMNKDVIDLMYNYK